LAPATLEMLMTDLMEAALNRGDARYTIGVADHTLTFRQVHIDLETQKPRSRGTQPGLSTASERRLLFS
jgi:hypothetical protein